MNRTRMQERVRERMTEQDRGHSTPCWISDRAAHSNGYTKIGHDGRTELTHRFAYMAFVGPIPDGLQIDHLCSVRACCNPDHLEAVDCRTNLLRGNTLTAAEVAQTHCRNGHPLSGGNLYMRPDRLGRMCRACRAESARRGRARRVA